MSDFKLDITYPYELIRKDNLNTEPDFIPYTSSEKISYRHYGRTLEMLIRKAAELEDGDEKNNLVALLCNHMRKNYVAWNKDNIDEQKIADDLRELSGGKLRLTDEIAQLMEDRVNTSNRPKNNSYQPVRQSSNNNSQRRRFSNNNQ
jgi:hypothetical protein